MVAMAAGFAVIVGVLGFALLTNEGTDAAAPLDVANAYIDARNAYDSDAVLALLADEPGQIIETVFGGFTGPSDYPSMIEWQEIIGWQFDVQGCREPQPGVIVCDYLVDLDLSRAIDAAPEEGVLRITVENGEIQSIANNYCRRQGARQLVLHLPRLGRGELIHRMLKACPVIRTGLPDSTRSRWRGGHVSSPSISPRSRDRSDGHRGLSRARDARPGSP